MSKAEPMEMGARARNYLQASGGRRVTPRQWRRIRHKFNRAEGFYFGHWGDGCKGRATPGQQKRRAEP